MTIWGDRLTALICSAAALYMGYRAWDFPANGDIFPKFIAASVIFVSALLVLRTFSVKAVYSGRRIHIDWRSELWPLFLTALVIGYVGLIFVLGYYTTTFLFLPALSLIVGTRSIRAIAIATIVTLPLLYAFFELFLNAQMPSGLLI